MQDFAGSAFRDFPFLPFLVFSAADRSTLSPAERELENRDLKRQLLKTFARLQMDVGRHGRYLKASQKEEDEKTGIGKEVRKERIMNGDASKTVIVADAPFTSKQFRISS